MINFKPIRHNSATLIPYNESYTYFDVSIEGSFCGNIASYTNQSHQSNIYIKLALTNDGCAHLGEICRLFAQFVGDTLQLMVSSHDPITEFLPYTDFKRVRRCYENEFSSKDLLPTATQNITHNIYSNTTAQYCDCSHIAFAEYTASHQSINPYSGSYDDFVKFLPDTLCEYEGNFVFVDDNELCYFHKANDNFLPFLHNVFVHIFDENDTIFFEADDIDATAMEVLTMFANLSKDSYDTYLLPK